MEKVGNKCPCGQDDCISADDPRYDGFRITEFWILTAVDPVTNQEGVLAFKDPNDYIQPAMATDHRRLEMLKQLAKDTPEDTTSLRIIHFKLVDEEVIK